MSNTAKQYVDLSGITVYDEEIKDYIDEQGYVSGTGTNGSLVKFNGTGSITDGPALGNDTTKYVRNDGTWAVPAGTGGISSLDDIPDVNITSVSDGQILKYDSSSSKWVNGSGGGMAINGANAAVNVGMTETKVFTIGDRTGKSSTGEYAIELGDGANATGYGAYAEGTKDYYGLNDAARVTLNANTNDETLVKSLYLLTYPYYCFGFNSDLKNPENWKCVVSNGLTEDKTITSGSATVRLTQDGSYIRVYYTNTGNTDVNLYYNSSARYNNVSSGYFSHAEGSNVVSSGRTSHAEGHFTTASGQSSHAEGHKTTASGSYSHSEGYSTTASGDYSHTEGNGTIAGSDHQHVSGKYNIEDSNNLYAVVVGNGTNGSNRSNAMTLDWSGNLEVSGNVKGKFSEATTFAVNLTSWTSSQSGTTLYKKSISLSHIYVDSPTVDIGAGTGYVLPTSAEQESYDLIKYATIDTAVPCLYLYATDIPTTAFYIKVVGVD